MFRILQQGPGTAPRVPGCSGRSAAPELGSVTFVSVFTSRFVTLVTRELAWPRSVAPAALSWHRVRKSRVGIDSSTLQMVEKWNLKPFFINVLHNTNKVLLSKVLTVHSFALNRLTLLKLLYMVGTKLLTLGFLD